MRTRTAITAAALAGLLGAAFLGFLWTREPSAEPATARKKGTGPRQVDQRTLQTARRLALQAAGAEEQAFARQALRLANHELDLAFAEALRQAVEEAPPPSPEARQRQAEKAAAEAEVAEDQRQIQLLSSQLAGVSGSARAALEDRLELMKARLELDQDELEEAAENLERAGGDPQARVRRLKASREAAEQAAVPPPETTRESAAPRGSVLSRYRGWASERGTRLQLAQAQADAQARIQRLTARQEAVATRMQEDRTARAAAKEQASGAQAAPSAETLAALRRFTQDQHRITSLLKRIQDHRSLGDVYGAWAGVVATHERTALNGLMRGLLGVLLVLASAFALTLAAEHLFRGRGAENMRESTLRTLARFGINLVAALAVLFMVFGLPTQTSTILGLAGAGLTVALKDFIVAFFGWFILMGRNGIRVGDWVEIRGVGGEVVEIGLLRTVLLETGSWSDAGHPTGRRVAFVNSFAMEGHFFNFTTSGKWMWDDLRVTVPPGQDPYPVLDAVQRLVTEQTRANAALAEKEWQASAGRYRAQTFSAAPGIQVVPSSFGLEIHVRYLTRAFERHATRQALYQAVVERIHGRNPEPGT